MKSNVDDLAFAKDGNNEEIKDQSVLLGTAILVGLLSAGSTVADLAANGINKLGDIQDALDLQAKYEARVWEYNAQLARINTDDPNREDDGLLAKFL